MSRTDPCLRLSWVSPAALWIAIGAVECRSSDRAPSEPTARTSVASHSARGVLVTAAPAEGAVALLVRDALSEAAAAQRTLVVYVGAAWCEPCQRFHEAARQGELDGSLPAVTLLEFDLDRDQERLASAGYVSTYIPLFALPREDGTASGQQVEGGIKGDGAVGFILPRLQSLLAR